MKKIFAAAMVVVMAVAMTSCSSVNYTARKNTIGLHDVKTHKMEAGTRVDFTYRVTATSKLHKKLKDAMNDALYTAIKTQRIDFVVDPIYEIEVENHFFYKTYTVTVQGYAGYFTEAKEILPVVAPACEQKAEPEHACKKHEGCCGEQGMCAPQMMMPCVMMPMAPQGFGPQGGMKHHEGKCGKKQHDGKKECCEKQGEKECKQGEKECKQGAKKHAK